MDSGMPLIQVEFGAMLHDSSSQCRSALRCDVVASSLLNSCCDLYQIEWLGWFSQSKYCGKGKAI